MKFLLTLVSLVAAASAATASETTSTAVHSGQASAEFITAANGYQPSKPVQAAIRLTVDPGWHTYWTNPGEGGMKLGIAWTLPAGWKAGAVGWPVPSRIKTGELSGFGYSGEILLPVTLTPPANATGEAVIGVKLNWLTCDEMACVPGEAPLVATLKSGEPAPNPNAALIEKARAAVPRPVDGLALTVKEDGKNLVLTVTAPAALDPAAFEVYPVTPQTIDNAATIKFAKSGTAWTAPVTASEYLKGAPKSLELVLTGGGLPHPALVVWPKK